MENLLSLDFWFNLTPAAFSPGMERFFFLFFGLMIIFGAVSRIVAKNKKEDRHQLKMYRMIASMLLTMGSLGLLWFFFTYEEAYLIGARFWFLLWIAGVIVWTAFIVRYGKKIAPEQRAAKEAQQKENKYLPRKKRR